MTTEINQQIRLIEMKLTEGSSLIGIGRIKDQLKEIKLIEGSSQTKEAKPIEGKLKEVRLIKASVQLEAKG